MVTFAFCLRNRKIEKKSEKGEISIQTVEEILLVIERSGKLFFPAGHCDPNETMLESAIREADEEVRHISLIRIITLITIHPFK